MRSIILLSSILLFIASCTKIETPAPDDSSNNNTGTNTGTNTNTGSNSGSNTGLSAFATDMLTAVNNLRAAGCQCGTEQMPKVAALKWHNLLEKSALSHASDMYNTKVFSHTGSGGSTMQSRIEATGYLWSVIGENIAYNYTSIPDVMKGWISSVGHCKQLMNANVTEIGAARVGNYWVQNFGKPR